MCFFFLVKVDGEGFEEHKKAWDYKYPDDRSYQHTSGSSRSDGSIADGTRTAGNGQRDQTADKGERSHQDWAKPFYSSVDGRLDYSDTFSSVLNRYFDDQNSVLTQQSDQHYQ